MFGLYQILASVAVSLAIGFGGGWATNGWRLGAEISQLQAQQAINLSNGLKTALDQTTKFQKAKDEALKKAEARALANSSLAAAARTESDVLRQQLESSRSNIPKATHDSLVRYTTTLSAVFGECQTEITGLGAKATGHTSDIRKLTDTWPTDKTEP
jgi:prophage DNA circulation protein